MPHLVITRDLTKRLDRVVKGLSIHSMRQAAALPGNPLGIQIDTIGPATCYLAATPGNGWWNRVVGLDTDDAATLDAILAFYTRHGVTPNIDLTPVDYTPDLSRSLAGRGLYLAEVSTILAGPPLAARGPDPDGLDIDMVGPDQADRLADLWAEGFSISGEQRELARLIRRASFQAPDNHGYIAYVEGVPAAMAALYIHDGIGFLNVAATLPAYRQRGIHAALTRRRVADALAAGCDLLVGHTARSATTSQNNMERRGLHVAYNQLSFTRLSAL